MPLSSSRRCSCSSHRVRFAPLVVQALRRLGLDPVLPARCRTHRRKAMATQRDGSQEKLFPKFVQRTFELPLHSPLACDEAKQKLREVHVRIIDSFRTELVEAVKGRWCPACIPGHYVTGNTINVLTELPSGLWHKKKLVGWEVWNMTAFILPCAEPPAVLIQCPVPATIYFPEDESATSLPVTNQHVTTLVERHSLEDAIALGLTADNVFTLMQAILTLRRECLHGFETVKVKGQQKVIIVSWQTYNQNDMVPIFDTNDHAITFVPSDTLTAMLTDAPRVNTAVGNIALIEGAPGSAAEWQRVGDALAASAVESVKVYRRKRRNRRRAAAAQAGETTASTSESSKRV